MSEFSGTIMTIKGRNLLAKAIAGSVLNFTRIGLGDGTWSNISPEEMTALVNECRSVSIQSIQNTAQTGTTRLRFVLKNAGLTAGFFMREIGIFARDPDLGEILYAVTYAGQYADFIPADGVTQIEDVTDIYTVISTAQTVTAVVDETMILATKEDITDHNENTGCHQDIRTSLQDLQNETGDIPGQISSAITAHKNDASAHSGMAARRDHVQSSSSSTWTVTHSLNTPKIPIVRAFAETTEEISLDGYSGSGHYCGDGMACGSGSTVSVPIETEIPYVDLRLVSQNRVDIRFATAHTGKAVLLF